MPRTLLSPRSYRRVLLAGASVFALLAAGTAHAGTLSQAVASHNSAAASAAATATTGQQQAAAAAQQSQQNLAQAMAAIKAAQATQAAARAAAAAAGTNGVTDGLSAGGLIVDPRVIAGTDPNLWANISAPVQTTQNGQTTVTLTQTSQRAVATWEQFNVGKNTTVYFDQSAGNSSNGNGWVVLNRIDATGVPSQIQGQIKAEGAVLLINPNGIVFTGTSQVNVHSLIAAAEDINSYTNTGAFLNNATGGNYVPATVNGTSLLTASGAAVLAPPNEDNANSAFLANGLYINNSNGESLIFSAGVPGSQVNQGIVVQAGASISTNVSGFDNGGLVALVGPSVTNNGSIANAAGQIILAASSSLWLTEPSATGSTTTSLPVSGVSITGTWGPNLTWVPAAIPGGAVVTNGPTGLLVSTRGNISLVGDLVNQMGVAEATTSITRYGSITLTANQQLTLGGNSVTAILPDENGETIPQNSASTFVAPSISINAANMDMQGSGQGQAGALIVAPGATMTVATGGQPNCCGPTPSVGRVLLESGSVIDLAGLDATASVADYLYTFKVTANDVADSPLAQNLIGQTVTINLLLSGTRSDGLAWVGSPLFSSSGAGYLSDIPQTIDDLLTKGGSLTFASGAPYQDVLQKSGSVINIAGGAITFTGATVNTTKLKGANGQITAIGSANPFVGYDGIAGLVTVDHSHWGIVDTYATPLISRGYYQPGYADGVSAGSMSITATNPVLEGSLLGATYVSGRQALLAEADTGANGAQATPDQLPVGAALSINTVVGPGNAFAAAVVLQSDPVDVLGPDFTMTSTLKLPTTTLVTGIGPSGDTTTKTNLLSYSTDILSAADLGSISINSASALSMAEGAVLTVQPGGSIKLGGVTTLDGSLVAHGGKITVIGYTGANNHLSAPPTSQLTIGPDAVLDASGLWVNDTDATGDAIQGAAHINGGSVTVETYLEATSEDGKFNYWGNGTPGGVIDVMVDTTQSIVLSSGSLIDVASGGYVSTTGKIKTASSGLPAGNGGNVSLLTYANGSWQSPVPSSYGEINDAANLAPYSPQGGNHPNNATVILGGTIEAAGLAQGGTFTLQAPTIQIGGVSAVTSYTSGAQQGEVALPASFFSDSGFSAYSLTSTYGSVTVTAGTTVLLQQKNYVLPLGVLPATGVALSSFATPSLALTGERQPVSLTLTELPFVFGNSADPGDLSVNAGVLVDRGAAIIGEPGAAITLTAGGPVTVLGSLIAPGGKITLTNNGNTTTTNSWVVNGYYPATATLAPTDVWIGPDAVLDVAGAFVPNPTVTAYATGSVLSGGTIAISGNTVIAMPGAMFDLAGASATIQVPSGAAGFIGGSTTAEAIWSNGGTLTFGGGGNNSRTGSLYFDGTVNAAGGAPDAAGGTLTIGQPTGGYGATYTALVIPQSGDVTTALLNSSALAGGAYPANAGQLASLLPNTNANAYITADTLNGSGFSSANLMATTIAFSGNVTLKVPGALTLAGNITLLPAGSFNPGYTAASIGGTVVNVDAGYLMWASHTNASPTLSDGTLNLDATAQIDIAGWPSVSNAANVNLSSGGDIRLVAETDPQFQTGVFCSSGCSFFSSINDNSLTSQSIIQWPGMLAVSDNLTLTAREVYPSTDSAFLLMSTGLAASGNTITIASNGAAPVAPLSADGEILIDAPTIKQAGVLVAPLGTIQLGLNAGATIPSLWTNDFTVPDAVATQTVTLLPGSLTSVSAAGLDVPYGTTVNDINWTAAGLDSSFPAMTAPPAKTILLNGATIDSQAGARVDLSGGGDVYATEFVAGTGGSRNVLTGAGSGQAVYALVPSYEAAVAASDPLYGSVVAAGTAVTLPGGNGIAAGTYTLLPAFYATLPGAYRVVVVSTNVNTAAYGTVAPDGSIYTTGVLTNTITGARSAQTALLEIQSNAVWTKYSQIDITSGNAYFANTANTGSAVIPPLPIDGGTLTIAATKALTLQSTFDFTPAIGGRGGEAALTGTNLLVLAPDQVEPAGYAAYLVLDSDQISHLGASAVLIGGTFSQQSDGTQITPTANNVVVDTDAAHPLAGPDLMLVATPTATSTQVPVDDPNYYGDTEQVLAAGTPGTITVMNGSVIKAVGTASSGTVFYLGQNVAALPTTVSETDIRNNWWQTNPLTTFYDEAYGGALAAVVQVSNGAAVVVQRGAAAQPLPTVTTMDDYYSNWGYPTPANPFVIQLPGLASIATISIGNGTVISGGNALTINGGNVTMGDGATISANNVTLAASTINLGNAPSTAPGLTLSSAIVAQLAGAQSVTLQSASVFNLYDGGGISFGTAANPIGTLTLDGAGFYSNGGNTTILAANVALVDSQAVANGSGALAASGGTLTIDAVDTITLGTGTKTLGGLAQVAMIAGRAIDFADSGSLDAGSAAVTLTAPAVVASASSTQSLTTTGLLTLQSATGTAPTLPATDIGGALTLSGGAVADAGTIIALAGNVKLTATSGDVVLQPGASIVATGSHIILFDATEDAPGGTVQLVANAGNVTIDSGATIDVSATGNGYAGSLAITTATAGTATLSGTLRGGAAYDDLGGSFNLNAGTLSGGLPFASGFTGSFAVTLAAGDITVPTNTTLTSGEVTLVANGGSVIVDGTIDASGPTGGLIQLYGAGTGTVAAGTPGATGVTIGSGAQLLATYRADDPADPAYGNGESTLVQNGGVIVLGTTGTPDGTTNRTYGYENVDGSGAITVASGAILNVSGGTGGANISNTGGEIIIRAPLLASGNVNVSFQGTVITAANGGASGPGVALDAYAVWSTTDNGGAAGTTHFDGIIDPAGWYYYNASGAVTQIAGSYSTYTIDASSGETATGDIFTPSGAVNANHVDFYQTTLVDFVQTPFGSGTAAVAADFAGATGVSLGTTLHLAPEIDLVSPASGTGSNGGNITVASNWNLGAGSFNAAGTYVPTYRTRGTVDPGEAGVLVLRAANNVQINATISDGFYEPSDPFYVAAFPSGLTNASLTAATGTYAYYAAPYATGAYMPGMIGLDAPPTAFPTSYNGYDQYAWYGEYYNYYGLMLGSAMYLGNQASSKYITANVAKNGVFDNNPNDYTSYAAYVAAYNANYVGSNFITGESTATFTASLSGSSPAGLKSQALATFDNNPADYGSYADYTTAYAAYATAMGAFIQSYYATHATYASSRSDYPSTILAPVPPTLGAGYYGGATESAALFQGDYAHSYASTAYADYAQYYSNYKVEPGNSKGTSYAATSTQLWLVALPYLPATSATPTIAIADAAAPGPANAIANNPGVNVTTDNLGNPVTLYDYNTTTAASLMPVVPGVNNGSFTYDFVAGAAGISGAPAVNPNAVISVPTGAVTTGVNAQDSVTINGHTSYGSADMVPYQGNGTPLFNWYDYVYQTIDVPTLVRTGTGSITITAAGSFELLDTTAPGVVYTAGAATTSLPANYTGPAPSVDTNGDSTNGLLSTPTWATNGGAVRIVVGSDIVGIETPVDDTGGSQTLVPNGLTGEFWSAWYYRAGATSGEQLTPFDPTQKGAQNTTWINYGTFFQGVGALGGGNVTLKAGGDIDDISASLPETIQVSGGQYVNGPAATANYYGGGDLVVQAGGNLYSSTFYVGRGTGSIRVGGVVATDPANPVTGTATTYYDVNTYQGTYGTAQTLPLLLAVQDGFISITATQTISLGGVFDPTAIPQDLSKLAAPSWFYSIYSSSVTPADIGAIFHSYGANSGLSLISLVGDVDIDTLSDLNSVNSGGNGQTSLFGYSFAKQYASAVSTSTAPATLDARALTGNINLNSDQSLIPSAEGTITLLAGGSISTVVDGSWGMEVISTLTMLDGTSASNDGVASLLGTPIPTALLQAWHADDPNPVIVYAGADITGGFALIKPAKIRAGEDIINTTLVGQNNNPWEITSVIAGTDILAEQSMVGGQIVQGTSNFELYGPGTFFVEAGRNLGPFFTGAPGSGGTGIETVGDGSNISSAATRSYLPVQGATIYALFGVGSGIDYQTAIADYVNPGSAGADGIDYLPYIATMLGATPAQAWTTFQGLSTTEQDLLIDRAFLGFLAQVGLDYNSQASPYYHQYARAYDTIATLFPASLGYTDNAPTGTNGTAAKHLTGNLSMAHSLIETQTGGDINILGPGGNIFVGANATDNSKPSQEGILTLQGGSILTYTDQSVILDQSRIFTEQGGDIDMFSANGDLNAGKGPKSSAAYPPLTLIWDVDGYTRVNPAGLVTGAGIGALLSVPGQDPNLSNVDLVAPRGTVDAGAAGIRVSGNLNIAALQVLNAFNIQVGGTATGIPQAVSPNIGALTSASNTAGAAAAAADEATRGSRQAGSRINELPSIITFEVIGYGGVNNDGGSQEQQRRQEEEQRSKNDGRHSENLHQDPSSRYQVIGAGDLTDNQAWQLAEEKRREIGR